jgi:hypothetical protein
MTVRNIRIIVWFITLFFIGIVADSAGFTVSQEVGNIALASEANIDGVWSILVSLWTVITFQVSGNIPSFISFIVLIITVLLVLDLISLLKGLFPFTSGE